MKYAAAVLVAASAVVVLPMPARAQGYQGPADLAIVIHVSIPSLFGSDGRPEASAAAGIRPMTDALEQIRRLDLPLHLAVAPVLCDELALLRSAPARRLMAVLGSLGNVHRTLVGPYAGARLTDLRAAEIKDELRDGEDALARCVGPVTSGSLHPPDLVLDGAAIKAAESTGTAIALSNLVTEPFLAGGVAVISADTVGGEDASAELAALRPLRAAAVVLRPDRGLADYLRDLQRLEGTAIRRLSTIARSATARALPPTTARVLPARWVAAVASADSALERFRSYTLPGNRLARIFRCVDARARSSAEWGGDWSIGQAMLDDLVRAIRAEQRHVTVEDGTVTFTSQRGSAPVTISSNASYPVRVRVSVSSPKLDFPSGSARVVTIEAPGDTITFEAIARSTGTFPMRVEVKSPRGGSLFDEGELIVRSTAANVSAVILTAGGAIFLIAFFGRRLRRRKR